MSPLTSYVVETLVTLVVVVVLAVVVLYAARRMGVGRPAGPLDLVGRLPLDGRRAVYLVRVEKRVFVLGASEAGLSKLGELDGDDITLEQAPSTPDAFKRILGKALGKPVPGDEPQSGNNETDAA
jgi:flagellar biogenesis protein FliO